MVERVVLKAGTHVGSFEILAPLGAGGMGEVYRAHDPRLEREVALKVLPAETLSDESARTRLLREARMASKLNHPNICTIYEVGEADGQAYIAMELVSGEALSERLSGERMVVDEALRLGRQMADALAHAHSNGVVHLDFKSGNVVITPEGRAKVLDFGLAARVSDTELTEATTYSVDSLQLSGKIAGTLAYMAPEQLKGEPADARSDIWALGVVLFEMASGVRPFTGKTGFELSSAILSTTPQPLPPGPGGVLPTQLQTVIDRCLEKEPARRYQSAGEVRAALETAQSSITEATRSVVLPAMPGRRWMLAGAGLAVVLVALAVLDVGGVRRLLVGGGGEVQAVRMAVLPFANLSGDSEQEYLSDGFTQELITQLGRLHPEGLSVIARTSVMRYREGDTPIDRIGRELDVDYVLEGSAQREADRIRINAELIHVGDQTQLWAESFERELSGVLQLQSEVAESVAKALSLRLLPAEKELLAEARPVNPEAHEAYLRGTYHWMKATPGDVDTAEKYFDLALEKDPSFAPAYVGRAWVWVVRNQVGIVSPGEAGPKAKAAALQALELDANSAEAHHVLASVKTYIDWDWDGAGESWRRTLELNPNVATAQELYAHFLAITGNGEEALRHSEKAAVLDPFNPLVQSLHAQVLLMHRRYEEAMAVAREAQRIQPDHPIVGYTLWMIMQEKKGMEEEAFEACKASMVALYEDPRLEAVLEEGHSHGGYAEAMKRGAESLIARLPEAFSLPTDIGIFYLMAGEKDKAIEWFVQGFEVHDPVLPYLSCFPMFDNIRSDPRFQDLLRRMNLPALLPLPNQS